MSVEQAIHRRWSTCRPLCRRLPVERVFTGRAHDRPDKPYAVLARQADRAVVHTSSGTTVREITARIHLWASTLSEGKRIVRELTRCFDLTDPGRVDASILAMRRGEQDEELNEDGSWRLRVDLLVLVQQTTGVQADG